jgi:hypothetical protein
MSTKTFDPNRVLPGTIELVRAADGTYTTKVVGLQTINSLSLPDISTTAAVTKTDTNTKTATEITGDTLQSQTQMAFKTGDDRGPDTTGDMLQKATKLSRNLSDFNPDTASEQFARQAFIPRQSTFDAEAEDSTENRTSIKDPTENVFGKSTLEDEQRERQTTLPDLSVDVKKKEPPGLFGFKFDRPITKEDFLGDRFKTTETINNNPNLDRMAKDSMDSQGGMPTDIERRQQSQLGSLGISADPAALSTQTEQEAAALGVPDRFKGVSQEGALAGEGEKQDVKPEVKQSALKTLGNSITTALKNIKTPGMALLEAVVGPESNIQKLNKSYFTDRGDGRIGGNPATDLYAGFNRTSAFGNLEKAGDKRISTREKTIAKKGYGPGDKFYDDTQKMKEQAKDYKKQKAATQKATQGPAGQGGASGTDSGRSKIVCTMMNESYGFGSFRNKIWMKFHGNIAPEYQKGYHKLFLPLVKYAKQKGIINKIIKNILEHIAVHSTIDMRQTLRGKRHTLGRLYRKIILPLCYWAGKK